MLRKLQDKFPQIIEEVRGVGLMIGIKINEKFENVEVVKKLISNGLLTIPASENVIRILPPLIINSKHIAEAQSALEKTFLKFLNSLKKQERHLMLIYCWKGFANLSTRSHFAKCGLGLTQIRH